MNGWQRFNLGSLAMFLSLLFGLGLTVPSFPSAILLPSAIGFMASFRYGPGAIGLYQALWDTPFHWAFLAVVGACFVLAGLMLYDPCQFNVAAMLGFQPGVSCS